MEFQHLFGERVYHIGIDLIGIVLFANTIISNHVFVVF